MKKTIVIGIFILIGLTNWGIAQSNLAVSGIQQIMKDNNAVGFSVAVVKNNKIIYTQSFGKKNIEQGLPLTDSTLFRIASISK
jgi:CubicO group peptidase (beta-lactamase class C family)